MEKGKSYNVAYLLNYIGSDKLAEIEEYISKVMKEDFKSFNSQEEVMNSLNDYSMKYLEQLNYDESDTLRLYTGFSFRNINAILRNNWTYEINGRLTEELKKEYFNLAEKIRKIMTKAGELPINIKTYRGVSIHSFYSYHISTLSDLKYMPGNFLYDPGFISTSTIRKTSFFYTPAKWGSIPNIEIEFLIPRGSDDGVLLDNKVISYSPQQNEYLLNCSSLFKVLNVEVNLDDNTAHMQCILIPEKIWNPLDYKREREANILNK